MDEESVLDKLKSRLHRALRHKAILAERTKMLREQVEDARKREEQSDHLVNEVLERQRELSFMLHSANTVLHRMQEANVALSAEFHDLVKELPEPEAPGWDERVAKINDLFKKTGALVDQAKEDIFSKQTPEQWASAPDDDETPPATPFSEHETGPAPVVNQPEPDQAEVFEAPEGFDQPEEPNEPTETTFTSAPHPDPEDTDRIERLFAVQIPENVEDAPAQGPPPAAPVRRPGLIRRFFRKITFRGYKTARETSAEQEPAESGAQEDARSSAA